MASSSGGMPKWLIVLLVIFLIMLLGCCGGFVACHWVCTRVVAPAVEGVKNAATQKAHDLATQREHDLETQMAPGSSTHPAGPGMPGMPDTAPTGGGGAGGNTPVNGTGGGNATGGGNMPEPTATTPPAITYGADNLPVDVPVMPGMTSSGVSMVDKAKGEGGSQFTTKSTPVEVAAYYAKQLTSQGWAEEDNATINGTTIMSFTKGTRKVGVMTVLSENGVSKVTVSFGSR